MTENDRTRKVVPKYIFELTLLGTNTVVFLRNNIFNYYSLMQYSFGILHQLVIIEILCPDEKNSSVHDYNQF